MLAVQEYLKTKTFDDLNKELGVEATFHDTLPLVILNYSQINSPKGHEIVRECRGLVLNKEDLSIVAKSFNRFFNMGEMAGEELSFNWSSCTTQSKEDGSLCLLYYFDGRWHANTRGSFGYGNMLNEWQAKYFGMPQNFTWHNGFCKALGIGNLSKLNQLNLDKSCTYVCEFCSPWNKVVRSYTMPCMYMLTRFIGEEEIGASINARFHWLQEYPLKSVKDIEKFLSEHDEATFEGVVIKDDGFRRWKLKNSRYLAIHHLKGNGENLWKPKYLLPFILSNEGSELLNYFPEAEGVYQECKDKVEAAYKEVEAVWLAHKDIENQKDFAVSIMDKTPFTGVLFNTRKTGKSLREVWLGNTAGILNTLF